MMAQCICTLPASNELASLWASHKCALQQQMELYRCFWVHSSVCWVHSGGESILGGSTFQVHSRVCWVHSGGESTLGVSPLWGWVHSGRIYLSSALKGVLRPLWGWVHSGRVYLLSALWGMLRPLWGWICSGWVHSRVCCVHSLSPLCVVFEPLESALPPAAVIFNPGCERELLTLHRMIWSWDVGMTNV